MTGGMPCDGPASNAGTSTRPAPGGAASAGRLWLQPGEKQLLGLIASLGRTGRPATAGWLAAETGRSSQKAARMLADLAGYGLVRKGMVRGRQFWYITERGLAEAPPP